MRPGLRVSKVQWRRKVRLERLYREALCPRFRIRVQMVLLSMAGRTLSEIAQIVRESDETVRRWLHRFMVEGCAGLTERERSGRPAQITPVIECYVQACIEKSPRDVGQDRATWTTKLLAKAVETRFGVQVTDECVRQHLARNAVVCRRPTWTVKHLATQEAGYAQKKGQSQGFWHILREAQTSMWRMKPS